MTSPTSGPGNPRSPPRRAPLPRGSGWVVSTPQPEFYTCGAVITMVRSEFGFSRVQTADGQVGYVANDQLRPAPTVALTEPAPMLRAPDSFPRKKRPTPLPERREQLDLSDIPLPLPI